MGIGCCKLKCFRRSTNKKIVLLLVGLDNAGKTTAARGLAGDVVEYTIPTVGFSALKPKTKGYDVTIYDLGGGAQIRDIWKLYFHGVHGVIYVVDASDLSRIEESKTILENLLLDEKLAGKPVLVLANKQDQPDALDEIDIVEVLQLEPLVNRQKCHTLVKVCSAMPDSSKHRKIDKRLLAGYRWLLHQIVIDYDTLNSRVEADSKAEAEKIEAQRALQRKRYEELEKQNQLSDGLQSNHVNGNGFTSDQPSKSEGLNIISKPLTSSIGDQLKEKHERQNFFLSRGRRSNKIHPVGNETELRRPRSTFSNPYAETSMTVRAITSPLHGDSTKGRKTHIRSRRPLTSRSLGQEGVWGLDREMDIIYTPEGTKDIANEDEIKDDIIVEYLKKERE